MKSNDNEDFERSLCRLGDRSLTDADRDAAKNDLVVAVVSQFRPKILSATGGRIGIDDTSTDLTNSAFIYLKQRATKIADEINILDYPIPAVVGKWLERWARDKIRRHSAAKRAGGRQQSNLDELSSLVGRQNEAEWALLRDELNVQVRAAVDSALAKLEDLERIVCLCRTGLGQKGEGMSMLEIAESQGVTLGAVNQAWRRAKRKLGMLLQDFDRE